MSQFMETISVSGWVNLLEELTKIGYKGRSALVSGNIVNNSAADVRVFRGNDNKTAPVSPKGKQINNTDAPTLDYQWNYTRTGGFLEASQTWIYAAAATNVFFDVTGAEW